MSLNLDKSAWNRVAFGEVVRNVNVTVRDPRAVGIDRVIAMEHLEPGALHIQRWGSLETGTTFTRQVMPGQTLFGKRRAYQRKVAYADFRGICSGDILTFEADETHLLPELLPFLVQSNEFFDHALGTSAGSLSPRTNWSDLSKFEFELPPLVEQNRIKDLLWSIERHQRALVRLLALVQADESIFGLARFLMDSRQAAWPTVLFSEAVKVSSGSFLPAKDMVSGNVPVYGGNGISGYHNLANFGEPVVMIGRVGAYCGVVHQTNGPSWVTDNALVIKKADGYDDSFLASILRHARLNQYASFTAQPAVSGVGLAGVVIARPQAADQNDYLNARATLVRASESTSTELEALSALKSSLLVDIFGGR